MKNLILVRGVSGSGKTTLAELFNSDYVLSTDDYWMKNGEYKFDATKLSEAHQWNLDIVKSKMEYEIKWKNEDVTIVVHNTFTLMWEMKPYFDLAEKYGYRVHTIIVENRHCGKNVHNVPDEVLSKQRNRFEVKL